MEPKPLLPAAIGGRVGPGTGRSTQNESFTATRKNWGERGRATGRAKKGKDREREQGGLSEAGEIFEREGKMRKRDKLRRKMAERGEERERGRGRERMRE